MAAVLCGVVLGLNRQLHGKRAGVRTLGVIALASSLATLTAVSAKASGAGATRVMQGIVAGIGRLQHWMHRRWPPTNAALEGDPE